MYFCSNLICLMTHFVLNCPLYSSICENFSFFLCQVTPVFVAIAPFFTRCPRVYSSLHIEITLSASIFSSRIIVVQLTASTHLPCYTPKTDFVMHGILLYLHNMHSGHQCFEQLVVLTVLKGGSPNILQLNVADRKSKQHSHSPYIIPPYLRHNQCVSALRRNQELKNDSLSLYMQLGS